MNAAPQASSVNGPSPLALPSFPAVIWIKQRGYVLRSALNGYKSAMLAAAQGVAPVEPRRVEPDPLVPLKAVCAELGVGRRTIGRRIEESQGNSAKPEHVHKTAARLSPPVYATSEAGRYKAAGSASRHAAHGGAP